MPLAEDPLKLHATLKFLRRKGLPITAANLKKHARKRIDTNTALALEFAHNYTQQVRQALGDNLLAAFAFGRLARGYRVEGTPPSDVDLMFITRKTMNDKWPRLAGAPFRTDPLIYPLGEQEMAQRIKQRDEEGFTLRRIFAFPLVPLHGEKIVRRLRDVAKENFNEEDRSAFVAYRYAKIKEKLLSAVESRDPARMNTIEHIIRHDFEMLRAIKKPRRAVLKRGRWRELKPPN
ncbi:MAG TPA: hypothetical protein VGQ00_01825 [Candidatus Norongarragalinales archaeon]|jgi:hypothetical protein|nr:hypothetical protein [Candidatus Norongarragalinales archaeon]